MAEDATLLLQRFSWADKESGTCPSGTAPPPRKATFITTLRWETLSEQVRQRLPDALTHNRPTPPAPALIRESGQETVSGFASQRLLQVQTPPAPQGEGIIAREV